LFISPQRIAEGTAFAKTCEGDDAGAGAQACFLNGKNAR
jgi:hypothetical protein